MRRRVAALVLGLSVVACAPSQRAETPRSTLVIGLDISGSFRRNPSFNGAIEFAALYIYGHLNGVGGLQPNTAIFVGELGGERPGQAKVFHPIQDLSGKSPAQIAADLRAWFPQEDPITDFNAFFQRAALHAQVMQGWRRHVLEGVPMEKQDSVWSWVRNVVDMRVRRERVL